MILLNIYATSGKWDDVANVRNLVLDRELKRNLGAVGLSAIKILHVFHDRDAMNFQIQDNYSILQ